MAGKLIVIVGDSNAVGQGDTDHVDAGLALTTAFAPVTHKHYWASALSDPVSWTTFGPASLAPYRASGQANMGIELTLGRTMYSTGSCTYVATFAINGTRAVDYLPSATSPVSGGNLMSQLKAYIDNIVSLTGLTLGGVVLELSTNDAATLTDANNYGANLATVISTLRGYYGSTLAVALPYLISTGSNTYTSTVRAAQVTYAAGDSHCVLVSSDDLTTVDGLHYSSDGYATRGQRLGFALSDLLGYARPVISADVPAYMGRDAVVYGAGDLTPRSWAGGVDGDLELLVMIDGANNTTPSLTSAQGFVQVGSTVLSTFSTFYERLSIYQRKVVAGSLVNGRMPSPTVHGNNTLNAAMILTFRGKGGICNVDTYQSDANNTYGTTTTLAGATTTQLNTLVAVIYGGFSGSGLNTVSPSNATLTSFAEQSDGVYFITSDYQLLGFSTGSLAAVGATGTTSVPTASNAIVAGLTLGLYSPYVPPTLTGITITPAGGIKVGGTVQLTATGSYSDSSTANITGTVTWSSGNANATVLAGLVTGTGIGVAYITAALSGVSTTFPIPVTIPATDEREHHPWPGVARGLWDFNDEQVVWTGDRILVVRDGDYSLGSSAFWNRNTAGAPLKRGLPAYLPLQTDSIPSVIGGSGNSFVETCLTTRYRAVISTNPFTFGIQLDVFDRNNGALINHTDLTATAPVNPRIMQSDDRLIATWMDTSPGALTLVAFTGDGWTAPATLVASVKSYEVAVAVDGVHFIWIVGGTLDTVSVGKLVGISTANFPYPWATTIDVLANINSVAIGVAPDNTLCTAYTTTAGAVTIYQFTNDPSQGSFGTSNDTNFLTFGGLSICSRGLKIAGYEWLVHYCTTTGGAVCFSTETSLKTSRYNTTYVSKSFRVGDEVFIWALDTNASTAYLLGGHYMAQVCGYADREVALAPGEDGTMLWLHQVLPDPLVSGDASGPYTVIKTGGTDATYDAAATSGVAIAGDGYVTGTALGSSFRWLALTDAATVDPNAIRYGLRLRTDATVDIVELGSAVVTAIPYVTGDLFTIRRVGTTLTYEKNGTVLRTRTAVTTALVGEVLLYNLSATLQHVALYSAGVRQPVKWQTANSTVYSESSGYGPTATGTAFTWARMFNTGQAYAHAGNVRVGDIEFLPALSTAQYGHGVYVSGSAVRCWDGYELGDAGFQSYPVTINIAGSSGGNLSAGDYYYRVYAVRYTRQGERFESAALTSSKFTATLNQKATLTIATLPSTNHSDVVLEVYRTQAGGTTFYYDGSVSNSMTAATVSYVSSLSDALIGTRVGDPHATGVGQAADLESFGPLGCAILANSGDRLWGAGGQVPPGTVQYSKLHVPGYAAGFDDIAGFQEVDTEGGSVTSVFRVNDTTVISELRKLYVLAGTGPDNYGNGGFNVPQIVLADGALSHAGTALCQLGTLYWGIGGPRLLSSNYEVVNISLPVALLTGTLTPTGCRVDFERQEAVWYTANGTAVLWNYLKGESRWAQWSGLNVAGVSSAALATTDGQVLYQSDSAAGDGGKEFEFRLKSGLIQAERVLGGGTMIRATGITGSFEGPHTIRARLYFDGSPLWGEQWIYEPQVGTFLSLGTDYATLTAAQIDALKMNNQSGVYMTHKRTARVHCAYLQVQISNRGAAGKTFIPKELTLEIGTSTTLARVSPGTFRN